MGRGRAIPLASTRTFELTPEEAVKPVGTEHTLVATMTDAEGDDPVADDTDVRFEVYNRSSGAFIDGAVTTTTDGEATFSYTGPVADATTDNDDGVVRNDVIVACASSARCIDGTAIDIDPITGDVDNVREDVLTDTAS